MPSATRCDLYEKVWSEAMSVLAPKLGLSDVGLKKVCKKHNIPTPYRGYWARRTSGHNPERTPLPNPQIDTLVEWLIEIDKIEPEPVNNYPWSNLQAEVDRRVAFESKPEARVTVGAKGKAKHPLACQAHRTRDGIVLIKKSEHNVDRDTEAGVKVSKASFDRAIAILDVLVCSLENRGFEVIAINNVRLFYSTLTFRLREQSTRTMLTNSYDQTVYVYNPDGRLLIELDQNRRVWVDGKAKLESRINDIVAAMTVEAADQHERDIASYFRWLEHDAEQIRVAKERATAVELSQRRQLLAAQVAAWEESERIRGFVAAIESRRGVGAIPNGCEQLDAWLAWASDQADACDPRVQGLKIEW